VFLFRHKVIVIVKMAS